MDLRGAVALVTGGNGGLGQRICHALAKEGVDVAVMYAQSRDEAESVARELTSRHQVIHRPVSPRPATRTRFPSRREIRPSDCSQGDDWHHERRPLDEVALV
jgi:NAD(P)-dependent dehydrogenase (short-subunit alcohol dehydrogenase family)